MTSAPGGEPIKAVLMAPNHFRAYEQWLRGAKLKVGMLPSDMQMFGISVYIVTPDHDHPRGVR